MPALLDQKKIETIEKESTISPVSDIAGYLREHLGSKMTAYVSGLNDIKEITHWIAGEISPRDLAVIRMRYVYQIIRMIIDAYGEETAKAWLFGTNTRLKDEAPAYILRYAKTIDDLKYIVPVARAFASATT